VKIVASAALLVLSLATVGRAVTLELTFDQPTFGSNTTGSFHLHGSFGSWGPGSSSSNGETTSYIFDGSFRGASTATPSNDFFLWMESYSATGTVEYGGSTGSRAGHGSDGSRRRGLWRLAGVPPAAGVMRATEDRLQPVGPSMTG